MRLNSLAFNIGLAAATLAFSALIVVLKKNGVVTGDFAERALGVFLGLMLVFYANFIPKQVSRAYPRGRRFVAWTLVLAFFAYAAIWALAPSAYAVPGSIAVVVAALAVTIAYCLVKRARTA